MASGAWLANEARNNIVFSNGGAEMTDEGEATRTESNLLRDPLFVAADRRDFHLQPGSPAIDAGADLRADGVATDFDGTSRPQGDSLDIGAYEYQAP